MGRVPRKGEKLMPVSKAQQKAVHKYVKANYDRMELTVPKGKKETIQNAAASQGQSVNAYINQAIDERMTRDGGGTPESPTEGVSASGGILTPAALETATQAAQKTGETVPAFVERAVSVQAQRDGASLRMGINPAPPTESQ